MRPIAKLTRDRTHSESGREAEDARRAVYCRQRSLRKARSSCRFCCLLRLSTGAGACGCTLLLRAGLGFAAEVQRVDVC